MLHKESHYVLFCLFCFQQSENVKCQHEHFWLWVSYLRIVLFILLQKFDAALGKSNKIFQLFARGNHHLTVHVLWKQGDEEKLKWEPSTLQLACAT